MEIMVAIAIFTVITLGLIQAFPLGATIVKSAKNQTKAAYVAQSKIEELISLGYDEKKNILDAQYPNGHITRFFGVPLQVYQTVRNARFNPDYGNKIGRAFVFLLKVPRPGAPKYERTKLDGDIHEELSSVSYTSEITFAMSELEV